MCDGDDDGDDDAALLLLLLLLLMMIMTMVMFYDFFPFVDGCYCCWSVPKSDRCQSTSKREE